MSRKNLNKKTLFCVQNEQLKKNKYIRREKILGVFYEKICQTFDCLFCMFFFA